MILGPSSSSLAAASAFPQQFTTPVTIERRRRTTTYAGAGGVGAPRAGAGRPSAPIPCRAWLSRPDRPQLMTTEKHENQKTKKTKQMISTFHIGDGALRLDERIVDRRRIVILSEYIDHLLLEKGRKGHVNNSRNRDSDCDGVGSSDGGCARRPGRGRASGGWRWRCRPLGWPIDSPCRRRRSWPAACR